MKFRLALLFLNLAVCAVAVAVDHHSAAMYRQIREKLNQSQAERDRLLAQSKRLGAQVAAMKEACEHPGRERAVAWTIHLRHAARQTTSKNPN